MRKKLVSLLFSVLAVLLEACSFTSTVVATLDDYDELLVGQVKRGLWSGGEFTVTGVNTNLSCHGNVLPPYAVANNLSLSCAGMVGRGNAECSDGRTLEFKWVADSCSRKHGEGKDSIDNSFYFVIGLDEAEAKLYIHQELRKVADKPPLYIYSRDVAEEERGLSTGTGFYVTTDGVIITSYHAIEGASSIHIMDVKNGRKIPASVLTTDPYNDIAVLKTAAKSQGIPLVSHFSPALDDEVFTLGYPLSSELTQEQKMTFGRIISLSGPDDDGRMVQIDVPIQPGNSGGPLLNGKGEVIGMITTELEVTLRSRASGSLPPNINTAINIDYIRPALESARTVEFHVREDGMDNMDLARIVELRKSSVLMVIAE
jgi:S1-C subfamily serine protease